jgi:hypothetical protein
MPMAQGFQARSPRIPPLRALKKHLVQGAEEPQQAQHDHHHARDTARSRAEHLLRALAREKRRQTRGKAGGYCP